MLEKKVNIIGEFQSQILIALIEQFFFLNQISLLPPTSSLPP